MKLKTLLLIPMLSYGFSAAFAQQHKHDFKVQKLEVIADKNFNNGIHLLGTNSANASPITQLYPFGKTGAEPNWTLAQWGSNFNLIDVKPKVVSGKTSYEDPGKRISFEAKDKTVLVSMEIIGSNEYPSPRKDNQDWPHLLLGQEVKSKVRLSKMQSLQYNIDARLMYDENKMGSTLNPKLHTSQVSFYLAVQNINEKSATYGDFFWFGLPLYDHRYRDIKEYAEQDLGKADATKKFILNVAAKDLFTGPLQDKQWVSIKKNIYPLLLNAFKKAQERGFLRGTQFSDLGIGSMNFGWEVPGTFDCGLQFKNLGLTAILK